MYGDSDESFLNTLYKEQTIIEMYAPDGFVNKATGICHYCTVDTLKAILNKECLRFSDVRFLNDSTDIDALSMWNYYAQSREGVNIVFNHSWNIFDGSNSSEVNSSDELENGIAIHRGLVIYKNEDKK